MKKLTIPVDALESERINKGIRRLVREGFLKDNPDSQICRVRNAAAGSTWRTLRDLERLVGRCTASTTRKRLSALVCVNSASHSRAG
ncbi:hypothetical protein M8494_19675 [Serratia ureilytica]